MAFPIAGALIGGALLGGLAGSKGERATRTIQLGAETDFEKEGGRAALDQLTQLQALIGSQSEAQGDVDQARQMQQDFIKRLQGLASSGGLPLAQDLQFGDMAVSGQRVQMNQALEQERIQQQRMAGQMGRSGADPIMAAKLAQLRQQGEERLGALSMQYALGNIDRTLGFQRDATSLQSGLASQALQNRQMLLNSGSQLWGQGANFRTGNASTTVQSGGGIQGAISGAFGGMSAGMSLFNAFGGGGTGGGGNTASIPTATNTSGFGNFAQP